MTPWTVAHQAPPSVGFPSRNTGVGCRFLLQLIVIRWCLLWGHILEYASNLAVAIVQSLSRVQLFATLWIAAPPGFPVLHNLPDFAQIHVYWVHHAIQPSHPLLPPSPPAFNLSQHQGLFKWVSSSHQVTKGLELQFQHILLSFQHLNPSLWPSGNQMPSQWVMCHSEALYWSREISSPGQRCVWEDRLCGLTRASRLQPRSASGHMTDLSGAALDTILRHRLTNNIFLGKHDHF